MANTEILAAIRALQTNFEVQLHATNKTIHDLHKSVDLWFDALQAGPLPARSGSPAEALAPASSPAFRSDGSSSVPQQRRGLHLLSVDVTSAAASTSFSAAPPPSASPAPPPSVVVSPPSPPSSAASPSPSAIAFPPSADSPLPLGSGIVLNRAGFAAPPPFISPTTILAAPPTASGVNLTTLFPVELFGKAPSPAPGPTPEVTSSPNSHIRPMPPTPPPTAPSTPSKVALFQPPAATISSTQFQLLGHRTKVGQIMEINFWPSPSDKEAQAMVIFLGTKDMLGHWWKYVLLGLFRRSVIFSLYALEEVYKDIFESPP